MQPPRPVGTACSEGPLLPWASKDQAWGALLSAWQLLHWLGYLPALPCPAQSLTTCSSPPWILRAAGAPHTPGTSPQRPCACRTWG